MRTCPLLSAGQLSGGELGKDISREVLALRFGDAEGSELYGRESRLIPVPRRPRVTLYNPDEDGCDEVSEFAKWIRKLGKFDVEIKNLFS